MPTFVPLQGGVLDAVPADPLAQLLIGLVVLLVVLLIVRFVMKVAWKLLVIAAIIVGGLYGLSVLGIPLPI